MIGLSKRKCNSINKALSLHPNNLQKSKDNGSKYLAENYLLENARISPEIKLVSKCGPSFFFFLEDTMEELFVQFKRENPGLNIGGSFISSSTHVTQCH